MKAGAKRRAERVASPLVSINEIEEGTGKCEIGSLVIPLLQSLTLFTSLPRDDAPRVARRLPLAIIFRAFGAALRHYADWVIRTTLKPGENLSCGRSLV